MYLVCLVPLVTCLFFSPNNASNEDVTNYVSNKYIINKVSASWAVLQCGSMCLLSLHALDNEA